MHLTFSRSVKGHTLQFNRLLYPLRYTIKLDEPGSDGKQYELYKIENTWKLMAGERIPEWLPGITSEINSIIEENEMNAVI